MSQMSAGACVQVSPTFKRVVSQTAVTTAAAETGASRRCLPRRRNPAEGADRRQ
jgi:hypothetical protein